MAGPGIINISVKVVACVRNTVHSVAMVGVGAIGGIGAFTSDLKWVVLVGMGWQPMGGFGAFTSITMSFRSAIHAKSKTKILLMCPSHGRAACSASTGQYVGTTGALGGTTGALGWLTWLATSAIVSSVSGTLKIIGHSLEDGSCCWKADVC